MRSRFRFTVIVLGILALAVPTFLLADATQVGTIKGRILDESGAGVPGATVEILSGNQGLRRSQTTDATGNYTFAALQPGPYMLRASLSGFQSVERTDSSGRGTIPAAPRNARCLGALRHTKVGIHPMRWTPIQPIGF